MKEILKDIYCTGVLNPNMRIFDVVMYTEYGTSYNSYLVKGSEKTAIIDAVHKTFSDNFDENVASILGDAPVDYLILNHTEPDHTGCIADFVKKYPNIELVASPAAAIYLKNITNIPDLKVTVVKDGDSISLGDKTLKFINAPFLHWPDSMFTYVPESKVLFSCDFLGAHYCEPQMYDYRVNYPDAYWDSLEYYYECIFAPFNSFAAAGLNKIKDLEIDMACTSHGPILTKDNFLPEVLKRYTEWSMPKKRTNKVIPLFYCTAYEGTKRLAEKIKAGILKALPDAEVEAYNIIEHDMGELHRKLNSSDAFLIGALTINRDAVPPIWNLLAGADSINMAKKPAALFGSFGWSGEAFPNVTARLEGIKVNVYPEQYKINFVPSEKELEGAVAFGESFAATLK